MLLRPRNFFTKNPALDVPPSFLRTPSQAAKGVEGCGCAGKKGNDGSSVLV